MAKSETIQRPEKGTELFDTAEKVFPDVQAEPGETAYTFMHTVPYEGSVGLVNLLTTTRVLRKGCLWMWEAFLNASATLSGSPNRKSRHTLPGTSS